MGMHRMRSAAEEREGAKNRYQVINNDDDNKNDGDISIDSV